MYRVLAFLSRSQFKSLTVPPPDAPSICVCTAAEYETVQVSFPPNITVGAIADGGGVFIVCLMSDVFWFVFVLFPVELTVVLFVLLLVFVLVLVLSEVELTV